MNEQVATARPIDHKALMRTAAPRLEPNVERDTIVRDAETGEPLALVARFTGDLARYRAAARAFPIDETIRIGGLANPSAVFGFAAKKVMLRRNGCRACAMSLSHPAVHEAIASTSDVLAGMLTALLPDRAERDRAVATDAILPEWFMGGWWTSGVVNRTSPLPYHLDSNNLDVWSAMVVVRRGTRGGHLHVPEYDLTLPCADGDVMFFPGYRLLHGVTPIRKLGNARGENRDAYRISAVYYTVSAMQHCGPFDESFADGRRTRSEREETMHARQIESGLMVE